MWLFKIKLLFPNIPLTAKIDIILQRILENNEIETRFTRWEIKGFILFLHERCSFHV